MLQHVRVSWALPLKKVSISNASHLTVVYSCAEHLTTQSVIGSILSPNGDNCSSTGNLTLTNSNFTAIHIRKADMLRMANVSVEDLMLENVTGISWNNVDVMNVDLLSLGPSEGLHSIWDHVTVNVLYDMSASSPLNISDSKILLIVS